MNEELARALDSQATKLERGAAELRLAANNLRWSADEVMTTSVPSVPSLLSIKEASGYSGLSVWAVRQLLADGRIAEVNFGRRRLVPKAAIDAFVEGSHVA